MTDSSPSAPEPEFRSKDPLHGITLARMLEELVEVYGWAGLGDRIPVRCFLFAPTITSSLRFLRKTPWAREKVEKLYRSMVTRE